MVRFIYIIDSRTSYYCAPNFSIIFLSTLPFNQHFFCVVKKYFYLFNKNKNVALYIENSTLNKKLRFLRRWRNLYLLKLTKFQTISWKSPSVRLNYQSEDGVICRKLSRSDFILRLRGNHFER